MTDWTPFDTLDRYGAHRGLNDQMAMEYGVFNDPNQTQTDYNAAAHAYTSAGLVVNWGSRIAAIAGVAREVENGGSTLDDTRRDIFNNGVGRLIGIYSHENNIPEENLDILVVDALNRGLLIVNEANDPRHQGYLGPDFYGAAIGVYDGPSLEVARLLENLLGLDSGSLPLGIETGPGLRLPPSPYAPLVAIRPMARVEELQCLPAHTPIQTSLNTSNPISTLLPGDIVLAFDPAADLGRGALVPRRITRLYRNTTTEWIKLNWLENGQPKELITTPGHHFLNDLGQFPTIAAMLRDGQTTVVLADGSLTQVTATRISYAADTAHLFDRALSFAATGNAAAQAVELDCWQTYNFEVEDLHTYVAGGVRVHNESGILGRIGNAIDTGIDGAFGFSQGSFGDIVTDVLTAPFHIVGEILTAIFPGNQEDKGGIRGTGLTIVDVGNDGDLTNDVFVDQNGVIHERSGDALDRDPEEEVRAQENLAYWQGVLGLGGSADSNGTDAAGNGAGGAGGNSGSTSSSNDDDGTKEHLGTVVDIWVDYGRSNPGSSDDRGTEKEKIQYGANLAPILLDLDDNGIQLTDLTRSTVFMAGDEGLEHRTAWAGAGDGVLFYDTDGDDKISDIREYVFTEWDPTAKDDLAALRSRFDTIGDGKLTAGESMDQRDELPGIIGVASRILKISLELT